MSTKQLCLNMRLVKLQNLVQLPRNGRFALLLCEVEDRWKVAIPGDINLFSLSMNNIDLLEHMKGYTFGENIANLKANDFDICGSWENISIDPDAPGAMAEFLGIKGPGCKGRSEKVPDRILFAVRMSAQHLDFEFMDGGEESTMMQIALRKKWSENDMPYTDTTGLRFLTGYGSCQEFYQLKDAVERQAAAGPGASTASMSNENAFKFILDQYADNLRNEIQEQSEQQNQSEQQKQRNLNLNAFLLRENHKRESELQRLNAIRTTLQDVSSIPTPLIETGEQRDLRMAEKYAHAAAVRKTEKQNKSQK